MLKALMWKEWREQRQVAAAGLAMALLLPVVIFAVAASAGSDVYMGDFAEMVPFLMAVVVWPLFAALAGASTNAEEAGSGSLDFLMSRPVSRGRLWAIKVLIAGIVLILIVAVSFWLAQLIGISVGNGSPSFPFSSDPISNWTLSNDGVRVAALGFVALSFAAAIFSSLFVRRHVSAAIFGMGAAVALSGGVLWLQRLVSATPRRTSGSEPFLVLIFLISTVAILAGALYVFRAGGMLPGGERRKAALVSVVGIAAVVLAGTVVSANVTTRIGWDYVRFDATIPDGSGVIIGASGNSFGGMRYGFAAPGQPLRLLTDRFAAWELPSPGGEHIVYATHRGPLGLRRAECELRSAALDGSDDHRVLSGAPCSSRAALSPDGARIATLSQQSWLWIGSIESGEWQLRVPLRGTPAIPIRDVMWLDDARVLVQGSRALVYVDAGTGEARDLYVDPDVRRLYIHAISKPRLVLFNDYFEPESDPSEKSGAAEEEIRAGGITAIIRRMPAEKPSRDRLMVVDLDSGRLTELPPHCPDEAYPTNTALSPDGSRLFYPGCPNDVDLGGQLRVYDFATGEDVALAEFDGQLYELWLTPAAGKLLVRIRNRAEGAPRSTYRYFVVDAGSGVARPLQMQPAWRLTTEWLDEKRLVVVRPVRRGTSIALLDVDSGETETIAGGAQ